MATIIIKGIDELIARLGKLEAMHILRAPMQRSVARVVAFMADYPQQRPGSTYRRTGTLGRRWTSTVEVSASGVTGRVGNNTEYGPFVQSEAFQAEVHQGIWQTDEDAVTELEPVIVRDFEDTIRGAL